MSSSTSSSSASSSASVASSSYPAVQSSVNAYKAVHDYISKILTQVTGMKALLMDSETVRRRSGDAPD
jgi:hypothetical protein